MFQMENNNIDTEKNALESKIKKQTIYDMFSLRT